jgi:hypothetical protein
MEKEESLQRKRCPQGSGRHFREAVTALNEIIEKPTSVSTNVMTGEPKPSTTRRLERHRLLLRSAAALERTAKNMQRFTLRHGGRHMELATDDELRPAETALNLLVGQPHVRPAGSD